MNTTTIFHISLILATLLVALVAGLVFAFAIITMPGIKQLNDKAFIRAFQVIDGVIQNNQPLFILVWMGSIVSLLVAAGLGSQELDGTELAIMIGATVAYLLGVQLPTIVFNIPLNNMLQTLNVDAMSAAELKIARDKFEAPWNLWNRNRTVASTVVVIMLLVILLML